MMKMEAIRRVVQAEREYEVTFRYGELEYDAPRITGAELLTLIQEIEDEGGTIHFYGPTVALYHPDGGVTEVALS